MMIPFIFWSAALVSIGATLMVLLSRNPFYAVLYLIMSLFGVSLIFFTLGAQFLAVLEIIVYAGAIMVLFLFVVQMLSPGPGPEAESDLKLPKIRHWIIPVALSTILIIAVSTALLNSFIGASPDSPRTIDTKELGTAMFKYHYLGVELASLVLLIGIIGGMHLGRAATVAKEEADAHS